MLLPLGNGIRDSNPIPAVPMLSSPCNLLATTKFSPHHVVQHRWLGHPIRLRHSKHCCFTKHSSACLGGPRAGLEQIAHNQVLVSATAACLIGQLSKPLTSALLGKGFNWRLALKSGGMPSTHSASMVASATAIGLERGFSDSLFGLSVVVAGIVMYDAQGVRRAVGKQAEVINMMIVSNAVPVCTSNNINSFVTDGEQVLDSMQSELNLVEDWDPSVALSQIAVANAETISSATRFPRETKLLNLRPHEIKISDEDGQFIDGAGLSSLSELTQTSPSVKTGKADFQRLKQLAAWRHIPLKESVGHTKFEVLVGGLVGLIVTFGLHWILHWIR